MRTEAVSREAAASALDRRRHVRYRFSAPITIYPKDCSAVKAVSLEISESGISALVSGALPVGEAVDLEPIAGSRVSALIRRHHGKIYGLEFLNLTPAQIKQIAQDCKALPKFQTRILDV
jgi:c-di-GMP-binding flagellar brake protein YcgR